MENRVEKPWDDSLRNLVRASLPVLSCVIYLLRDGNVPETPLRWTIPTGQPVLDFYFENIRVGEWSSDELLQKGEPGLLPLLPLTRGGTSREVTTKMFASLEATGQKELLAIGGSLASLMFKRENRADLSWLHRRLREMHNLLRESPYYQEILQEGREEGLKEGLEEGLKKGLEEGLEKGLKAGKLEGLRESLLAIVQARFPKLVRLAKGQAAIIDDSKELESLAVKVSLAQNPQEARRVLLDGDEDEDSN